MIRGLKIYLKRYTAVDFIWNSDFYFWSIQISEKILWKLVGSDSHWSVPPLFCDFIIAYIFTFFNWHFNRSFFKVFVEQGEVSVTFWNRIYKACFLWYNKNVGACCKTGSFLLSKQRIFKRSTLYRPKSISEKPEQDTLVFLICWFYL